MSRHPAWDDESLDRRAMALLEEPVDPSGPLPLPHLGSRPGWSPDREDQVPAFCTVCGLPPDDAIPPDATIAPDPITHGELATFVCVGCGFTRSRSHSGTLRKPSQDVLDDYATEDRDVYHDRPDLGRRSGSKPSPAGKPRLAGGLEKITSPVGPGR